MVKSDSQDFTIKYNDIVLGIMWLHFGVKKTKNFYCFHCKLHGNS